MIFYIIVFLILTLNYVVKDRKRYSVFVGTILVLFAGLRHSSIGPDTSMYQYIYEETQEFGFVKLGVFFLSDTQDAEPGYLLFQYLCGLLFNYDIYKFLCSAIQTIPAIYIIHKYSRYRCISYLIYFCLPVYTMMSMSMMRQGIAFAFFLMAFPSILERNFKKYLLLIFIGFLFHATVIAMLPVYFFYNRKYKRSYNIIIFVLIVLSLFLSQTLFGFIASFSRMQYEAGETEGVKMLIFMILCFLCSYFVPEKKISDTPFLRQQLYMLVYTILIWCIAINLAAVLRLAAYTEFFIALYVTNVLGHIRNNSMGKIIRFAICIGCIIIMQVVVMRQVNDIARYYPYYFLWEK